MPRTSSVFQVFVASPSDVSDERILLEGVINQLNQIWSKSLGLTFELLKWESDVYPSFSTDPQAAINEQIGLEYDVFIGIFWGRLGTPTPRAPSGTLEEFDRAYSRFTSNKSSPEIMIYFKDAGIAPSKTDTEQLHQLNKFRASLAGKGGLYSMFEDQAGFESSLRSHLSALAQKFSVQQKNATVPASAVSERSVQEIPPLQEEDDYGYLDYSEIFNSRLAEVTTAMTAIGQAIARLGEQLTQRTAEMKTVDTNSVKDVRRNAQRAADDMNNFADAIKPQVAVMTSGREVAFDALSKALSLQTDFNTDKSELHALKETLGAVIGTATRARNSTSEMRGSVGVLPRISKELNGAKRAVLTQLDRVIAEFDKFIFTLENITGAIDKMLGDTTR